MEKKNIFDLFELISKKGEGDAQKREPVSWLVVGLGNPGKEYVNSRHNAGFDTLDFIAAREKIRLISMKFQALICESTFAAKRVLFMKPQTFMNSSGNAVREASAFYKIPPERILVICDDVSFDVGKLRIRRKGSDGGQKGVKSIIEQLNSDEFPRIKLGVGKKPHPDYDLASWVLSDIPPADRETFREAVIKAVDAAELIVNGEIEKAMQLYN